MAFASLEAHTSGSLVENVSAAETYSFRFEMDGLQSFIVSGKSTFSFLNPLISFIKRFVNLNGKTKLKEDILRFINSLQKAIVEKR
ncbi:MAG: hypothetical protein ABI687_00395 [Flavitalea sp.]